MRVSATAIRTPALCLSVLVLCLLPGCAVLPAPGPQAHDPALPPAEFGTVREVAATLSDLHGAEHSTLLALPDNREAMLWRLMLIDEARSSLDLQYFIWDSHAASALLFDRLLAAADRGVRVRLLVDDLLLDANDSNLAAVSAHPHFEIRLFNPGRLRRTRFGRVGEMAVKFRQLNRRMHNKLLIVDGSMAIAGGRNVGDEYFGLGSKFNFRDLDVLVAGAVVPELSVSFDQYWNNPISYPTSAIDPDIDPQVLIDRHARLDVYLAEHAGALSAFPMQPEPWADDLWRLLEWMTPGDAHFLQDIPEEVTGREDRLVDQIVDQGAPSRQEIILVAPYLIPTDGLMSRIAQRASEGLRIKILTASMASNNHTSAHSHYKKYRRRLLELGAELYEFRAQPSETVRAISDTPPFHAEFISLHIKAIVGDRNRCTVGSLNLDPRAMVINTENVLYIRSAEFCGDMAEMLEALMQPENAWRVELDGNGRMTWTSSEGTVDRQPARSGGQRVSDFFFRLLPLESQL